MLDLLAILLKINLVLLLFAAVYYLVLRPLTFYRINRLFLLFGLLFSTVYPFIDLTELFRGSKQLAFVPQLNVKAAAIVPSGFLAANASLITTLFYAGVAIMAMRLLIQFVSLYLIHKRSTPGAVEDHPVRILNEEVSPFSFWRTIYVNPKLHAEKALHNILEHEKVHVREWHTIDIILSELSVVFYWFNPGVWLMKRAVKENLEFITDQQILRSGTDRKAYQYSLIDVVVQGAGSPITNNFNLSDLKKRILMMNAKRSSRVTLTRYLLLIPVLAVCLVFTVSGKSITTALVPMTVSMKDVLQPDAVKEPIIPASRPMKKKLLKIASADAVATTFPQPVIDTLPFPKAAKEVIVTGVRAVSKQYEGLPAPGNAPTKIVIGQPIGNGEKVVTVRGMPITPKANVDTIPVTIRRVQGRPLN